MHAAKNGLWHAQGPIPSFVPRFFPAPEDHAWFLFENLPNGLLAECPEIGDLDDGIVLLISQVNGCQMFRSRDNTERAR